MSPYLAAGIALAFGVAIGFFIDRLRMGSAYRTRDELIKDAEKEADTLLRTKEIELKEEFLRRREDLDKELDELREKLRQHERQLDKREHTLNDQEENLKKRERMVEQTQNRIADRSKLLEKREADLDKIIEEEQEKLYTISGLSKEEATERLLTRLDKQLKSETGSLILKHQQELKQESEKQAR